MRALRLLPLALTLLLPLTAAAQDEAHTLEPGDTVRVQAPAWGPRVVQGELLLYRADSLALREAATGARYSVPLEGIRRLQKNEGLNRRRSVRRHAVAGLFMGIATGVVLGPLVSMERKDENFVGATLVTSLGGGALGLSLGAASGSLFARDHWQRFRVPVVPPPPPPATLTATSIPASETP